MIDHTTSTAKRIAPMPPGYLAEREAARNIYTELHQFIDETRKAWNDKVAFGTWLGACKGFTRYELGIIRGSVNDSNARHKGKLFFWKLVEARKQKRRQQPHQMTI